MLVILVSLIIVYRWKNNKKDAPSSAHCVNTDTWINIEGCHGDGYYDEIRPLPQCSSGDAVINIYTNANFPRVPSEETLNYASVNFHKDPPCPTKATDTINQMETSFGEYSNVNISQSPVHSTYSHPQSSSETPPIYSELTR
ncbi:hypothetical protein DPEC_G00056570 [Dallia pectoralis]|uniref:Uncharacterized protein n=1 Tax=Dallia pectoralis TaxID=75939 RepID=A0ACC2H697_DALPE|nr:hypothetical protein DPEC_G00056570 [Dallia pectoralis]